MSTFVTVGNAHQPFQRLLNAVAAIAAQLPQPVIVQYGHGHFDAPGCDARAFIPMEEFERIIDESEVIIAHAGAGAVVHALRTGKVPVVVPRRAAHGEHVDDHQRELADALSQAGRVVVVDDVAEMRVAIVRALSLQRRARAETRVPELVRLVGERLARYAEAAR